MNGSVEARPPLKHPPGNAKLAWLAANPKFTSQNLRMAGCILTVFQRTKGCYRKGGFDPNPGLDEFDFAFVSVVEQKHLKAPIPTVVTN